MEWINGVASAFFVITDVYLKRYIIGKRLENMERKKRYYVELIMAFLVMIAAVVWVWPGKQVFLTDRDSSTTNAVLDRSLPISEGNMVEQFFEARSQRLKSFAIYLVGSEYDDNSNLNIVIKDASADETVFEKEIPLAKVRWEEFYKIKVSEDLIEGDTYSIQLSTSEQNHFVGAMFSNNTDQMCLYNGDNLEMQLAMNTVFENEANAIQTLMLWLLFAVAFFAFYAIITALEKGEKASLQRYRKVICQVLVIVSTISAFLAAALVSPISNIRITQPRLAGTLLWIVTNAILWIAYFAHYVKRITKEQAIAFIKDNKEIAAFLFFSILIRIPMLGTIQKWDGGEYYYSLGTACKNFNFTFQSLFDYFRLCNHSCMGFSLIMGIGEFLNPRGGYGVQIELLILTIVALYCLYKMYANVWLGCTKMTAVLLTAVVSVMPLFYGTYAYVNTDYFLTLFFIFMIYAEYKQQYILMTFFAIIVSQSKETGVIVILGYLGMRILWEFVTGEGGLIKKTKNVLHQPVLMTALLAAACYAYQIFLMGSVSAWTKESDAVKTPLWSNTGSECFGFNTGYIVWRMKQYFVSNFLWIFTGLLIVSLLYLLCRKYKNKKKAASGTYVGLIGTLIAFILFGSLYITAGLNRYNVLENLLLVILALCVSYRALCESEHPKVLYTVTGTGIVLLGIQSFWNIDVVSNHVLATVSTGEHTMLYTDYDSSYYGDGLVNNYQYAWIDMAFDKMLKAVDYDEDMQVFVTRNQNFGSHINGNGEAYKVGWNTTEKKRQIWDGDINADKLLTIRTMNTGVISPILPYKYDENYDISGSLAARGVIYFLPYYEEDEAVNLKLLEKYYYIGERQTIRTYGGTLAYYTLSRKGAYQNVSVEDAVNAQMTEPKTLTWNGFKALVERYWNEESLTEAYENNMVEYQGLEDDRQMIQDGDRVRVDISCYTEAGDQVEETYIGNYTNSWYTIAVGDGDTIDEMEKVLIGKNVGDTIETWITVPEDYPLADKYEGQKLKVVMTILKILAEPVSREIDEDQQENIRNGIEDAVWSTVSTQILKQYIAVNYSNGRKMDQEERDQYVWYIEQYYDYYLGGIHMTRNQYLEECIQMPEEKFSEIEEVMAQKVIQGKQMENILETYKTIWDVVREENSDKDTDERMEITWKQFCQTVDLNQLETEQEN